MPADPPDKPPTSPYGPQDHTDEAAGGADSSPYEATPSEDRPAAAKTPPNAPRGADRPGR